MNVLAAEQAWIAAGGSIIEAMAAVVIAYHVLWALSAALKRDSDAARLYIARGVLTALGFSLAGTLLKTIALQTWPQIRIFAFVFVLRTSLKRVFLWEEQAIRRRNV